MIIFYHHYFTYNFQIRIFFAFVNVIIIDIISQCIDIIIINKRTCLTRLARLSHCRQAFGFK